MYNHLNQYRCTIIRGKSRNEIDDLLPAYAKIIDDICPCKAANFHQQFNRALSSYMKNASEKTLDNHRTEIVGKLFGMYYLADDGYFYPSERSKKFIEDNDQPAFFKDVCFKMQFPNGMDKAGTIIERKNNQINIRQNSYLLKVLLCAQNEGIVFTKNDIGYYVLNSLDVLRRVAQPLEIIKQVSTDRKNKIIRKIHTPGKKVSYDMQHINEQINYLELANLLIVNTAREVSLNMNEINTIEYFSSLWNLDPIFNLYDHNLDTVEGKKQASNDWDRYFAKLSDSSKLFRTTISALGITDEKRLVKGRTDLTEIGDEGEAFVYEYEKQRVTAFDRRLAGKVLHLGKTRGLGYDIQSVVAEDGDINPEFVKYIEVKSTKRVTEPNVSEEGWIDTVNMTRNEWVAAQQHKDSYSIIRVYFVRDNVIMYVIKNVYQKEKENLLTVVPMTYRVDFSNSALERL